MKTAAALVFLSTGLAAAATGGSVCAYIAPGCALLAPVNDACTTFSFDVCAKAPSSLVNWYYRTTMDAATKRVSVKRFSDAACSKEEAQWAVSGGLGDCLGPIDKVVGIEAYIKFTSDTAPAPAPAVKPAATAPATKPGTQAAVSTVAAGPGRIETSAAVKPATTGAPAPSGTAGVVSVAAANTTSTAPTAQAPAAAQTTAKSAAARTGNSALAGLATLLACLLL